VGSALIGFGDITGSVAYLSIASSAAWSISITGIDLEGSGTQFSSGMFSTSRDDSTSKQYSCFWRELKQEFRQ
jgi:hypothetical protein